MIGSKIEVVKYAPTDPRLGRHVEHDNRSKQFAFLGKRVKPEKKTTHWTSAAAPLDQGELGSCTGNALAQWLNTDFAQGYGSRAFGTSSWSTRPRSRGVSGSRR